MTKKFLLPLPVGGLALAVFPTWLPAQQEKENNVIMGPNYEKGQQSLRPLVFVVPQNWVKDEKGGKKRGMYRVLVPSGTKLENADRVITIAFQKKSNHPGMDSPKSFFKEDLQETLAQFPDEQFARWQPPRLNPDKLHFMSIAMYGKEKDKPSPQRFPGLDSGDGYFSISLTASTRGELQFPISEEFVNSIDLGPQR